MSFHCWCSFVSLIHLALQSFLHRIYQRWCVSSSTHSVSGNSTQDSKAIVECKIRQVIATQNVCHFISFLAWEVKISYCNGENKPKSCSFLAVWLYTYFPALWCFLQEHQYAQSMAYCTLASKGKTTPASSHRSSTFFTFWGWKTGSRHLRWFPVSKAWTQTRNTKQPKSKEVLLIWLGSCYQWTFIF